MQKENIMDLGFERLERLFEEWGESKYRFKQVLQWVYSHRVGSFEQMSNLSKALREKLHANFTIRSLEIKETLGSVDGSIKFIFSLLDGLSVEGVFMPDENKGALCISTQVGCKLNCAFCMTGKMGFIRNLSRSEIICQVLAVQDYLGEGGKVTNIVLMGMGEPLDNYENTIGATKVLNSPMGLKIGARKITLSTAGLIPALLDFQKEDLKINLAISLNSVEEDARTGLMPINKRYPLKELLEFCRAYPLQHSRRITFEYVLIGGLNDSEEDAIKLVKLLRGIRAKVNLIPFNEVEGLNFNSAPQAQIDRFHKILIDSNITVFTRKSRGSDVHAACGQLGRKWEGPRL